MTAGRPGGWRPDPRSPIRARDGRFDDDCAALTASPARVNSRDAPFRTCPAPRAPLSSWPKYPGGIAVRRWGAAPPCPVQAL
ncbi:hypothetical protein E4191_13120 [Paracoccus liaowanqingii]|uniref:Uncharacterized protein n=1 Tax=Paracoccus liaowanqingii TaxID=2560053 RepID=A0A4P7HMQ2_9RHOB|nr:hypothetical protein E4191_13120 [Paracoccus liaowanqingii]